MPPKQTPETFTKEERDSYAREMADLREIDVALLTAIDLVIKTGQPAWVTTALLAVRKDYGLSNEMYIQTKEPDQQE